MPTSPSPRRPRSGLTIVEVLVALIIVTIGLLGIAGSSALALRTTLDSTHRRQATQKATSRFARLASEGCAKAASGAESDPVARTIERWTVTTPTPAWRTVVDSVSWMSARGSRTFTLTTAIQC